MKFIVSLYFLIFSITLSAQPRLALAAFDSEQVYPWKKIVSLFVPNARHSISALHEPNPSDVKIEIGAADIPFCKDCVQVDKFRNRHELFNFMRIEAGLKALSVEDLLHELGTSLPVGYRSANSMIEPWAAAKNGVIADARDLPFKDKSVSLIILKRFPWLISPQASEKDKTETRDFSRAVLKELSRVLAKPGLILVLGDAVKPAGLEGLFAEQALIANDFGLSSTALNPIATSASAYIGGIVITNQELESRTTK